MKALHTQCQNCEAAINLAGHLVQVGWSQPVGGWLTKKVPNPGSSSVSFYLCSSVSGWTLLSYVEGSSWEQREDIGKEVALDVSQTLLLILEDQEDPQFWLTERIIHQSPPTSPQIERMCIFKTKIQWTKVKNDKALELPRGTANHKITKGELSFLKLETVNTRKC